MKITILTLFPDLVNEITKHSIIKRAVEKEQVKINVVNFRDYSTDKHKKVDDYGFGPGAGMVLKCQPIIDCLKEIKTKDSIVYMMSPQGQTFNNKVAKELATKKDIIILCGHYEGFDERIRDYVDAEISIGDYVLTGGEIAAMAIIDATIRLIPGVIKEESHIHDSFENGFLDYPSYTKPLDFDGKKVPEVLTSGNHKLIEEWRNKQAIAKTKKRRKDLIKND